MQYTPYIWLKLFAAIVPIGFALYMRRFREIPSARPFSLLMVVTALWALLHVLISITHDLPLRLFLGHIQVVPFVLMAPMTVLFAFTYTNSKSWLVYPRWHLLLIVPLITILLEWTSNYHTLYRYNFALDLSGSTPSLSSTKGLWYWLNLAYVYGLITLACGRLLTAFPIGTSYFWNAVIITLCFLLPFTFDALYTMWRITPIPGYNLSSTVFIFTGALQIWALLRLRLFDLIPVARETMIEQMREGMIVLDSQRRIIDVNPAAAAILNATHARLIGHEFQLPGHDKSALITETTAAPHLVELEIGTHWYQISSAPLADRRNLQTGRLIILRDITELKQTHLQFIEQQRALAMTEERAWLARELHDGLGQVLGYVKMRVQIARELLARDQITEVDSYLINLAAVTHDAHTDIREYLLGIRAVDGLETAFLHALEQYLIQFTRNYSIHTDLQIAPDIDPLSLSPTVEVQLLRIIQEALTNVRKYAHATRIDITLARQTDQLHIVIADDGQGFDPQQITDNSPTFGLRFMRERTQELHGRLEVASTPNQGTRITIIVPLPPS